jgi:hypothetical protein
MPDSKSMALEDTVGEQCVGVLLSNRPYPPTRRPTDLAEIG